MRVFQAGLDNLKATGLTIKEGANFKFQLSFRVNHELLEGLKFVNKTKRAVRPRGRPLLLIVLAATCTCMLVGCWERF